MSLDWRRLSAGLLAALLSAPVAAEDEETVKIGYFYNFTKFVDWPPSAEAAPDAPLTLCVLGDDIVKNATAILEGKSARQRPVLVADAKRVLGFKSCRAILIDASEGWRIDALLQDLKDRPVLTVSDADSFAERGGMIELLREGDKVRFEINLDAIQRAGLKLGSQVAKLAVRTYGKAP